MKLTLTQSNKIRFYVAKSVADTGTGISNPNALWQDLSKGASLYYKNYHNEVLIRVIELSDYLYLVVSYPGDIMVQQYDKSGRQDLMNIAKHYRKLTNIAKPKHDIIEAKCNA